MPNDNSQYIKLPDGSYGKFSSTMSDDDIASAIDQQFPKGTSPMSTASSPSRSQTTPSIDTLGEGKSPYQAVRGAFGQPVWSVPAEQEIAKSKVDQARAKQDYDNYVRQNFPAAQRMQDLPPSALGNIAKGLTAPGTLAGPPTQSEFEETRQWQQNPQAAKDRELNIQTAYAKEHPILSALGAQAPTAVSSAGTLSGAPPIDPGTAFGMQPGFKRGVANAAAGMLSPGGIGMLLTMPESKLVSAYYAGTMSSEAYQGITEARKRYAIGDVQGAHEILGGVAVTSAFAALSASHFLTSDGRTPARTNDAQIDGSNQVAQQRALEFPTALTPPDRPHTNAPAPTSGQLTMDFSARPSESVPGKLKNVPVVQSEATTTIVQPQVDIPKLSPEQNQTVNDAVQKVDVKAKAALPENQPTDVKVETDGNGTRWAVDPKTDYRVAVPKRIADGDIAEYARPKLAEQAQLHSAMMKRVQEEAPPPVLPQVEPTTEAPPPSANAVPLPEPAAEAKTPATESTQSGPASVTPVSPELPGWIKNNIERLPEAQRLAAATDELSPERKTAVGNLLKLKNGVRDGVLNFIGKLGKTDADLLRKDMIGKADRYNAQADEVQRIIDNHPIAEAIREEMAAGRPTKSPAGGITIIGSTHADMRTMLHEAMGDETSKKFDEIAINQRAKLREKGVDPDAGVEADRKALVENAKKELAQLQVQGKKKLIDLTQSHLEKNASRVHDIGQDEALAEAKKVAAAQIMTEKLPNGQTMRERVAELRDIIGRDAQRDVYTNKGKAVVEDGVVKHPGEIAEKTLDLAQKIWGRKLNKIPSSAQWDSKVNELRSFAETHNWIADRAGKRITDINAGFKGQEGFAAISGPALTERSVAVPTTEKLVKKMKGAGYEVRETSADTPGFDRSWISPDGKYSVRVPLDVEHDSAAADWLGSKKSEPGDSTEAMLKAGWIRKANYNSYQMQRLTPSGVDAIEKDIITNGRFSKGAVLDQVDSYGKLQSFDIDPGWDDLKSAFAKELRSKNRYEIGDEAGFASLRQMATTGSAVAGAAIGYSVGGEQGAIIGAGVGLAAALGTPSVAVRVPALFRQSLTRIQNMLSNTNISIKDWYIGKTQRPVDTDMQSIIDKQNTSLRSGGAPTNLLQRMGQIPGDVLKQFDPLIFVNDRLGPVMSRIMNLDTRGKQFRDLNGRLSIDDSPYVIATNAIGGGSGAGEVHLLAYKGIFQDAHESGSLNEVYKYLNLKGYKRVWDVLQDRMWTMDSQINNLQQQLFAGQFGTPRERIAAEDQLADVNKQKAALQDQMAKGKVTPDNYDPAKINNSLIDLQQQLGPAQFSKVEAMGKRVFALNRQVLDQVHNAGIISHEDYQKYTARGDEYIPMHRILEQVSDNEFQTHGSSPLYLKQQNVINALRGSGKVNVNPIVASADANLQALKEVARNGVIHNFVQLANKDPKGVGQLFTEVAPGYKPKAGESTVGWYDNGKQRTYAVPDYLGATLQHASPISVDTGMGAMLRFTKNVLQAGATSGNLAWSLPNAIRHFGDMAIMSKAGLKLDRTLPKDAAMLVKTWGEALKSTLAKDQSYQEYVKSGAAYSTLQRQITPEAELDPNQIGKAPNWRTRPLDAIRRFNQAIEDTTKLTTFKRLKQMGYSDTAAAFETRRYGGGPDFARMGAGVSNINQIAMFFNAHLQYVARTFQRVGEDPVRMAMFMGALSTIALSLNQHNWQYKLPNGQPSMQAVPVSDRENNFVIMTGDSYITENGSRVPQYYKVPKPSVLKFLYNPIEQVVNGVAGRETRSGTQQTLDTLSAYVPGQLHADVDNQEVAKSLGSSALANLNPLLSVPGEQAMNYQAFGERPIVPQRLQGVEPGKQSTPTTPEVYKEMGQGGTTGAVAGGTLGGTLGGVIGGGAGALVGAGVGAIAGSLGMSPLRLQQAVNGTTGGIGQAVAGIGDFTSERNFPFQGQQATRQIPGVGTLASRFIGTPINQRDKDVETKFYSQLDQVSQVQRTYQSMANTQPQQAGEYLKKNIAAYRAAVVGSEMKKEIGELNSIIAMTQDSNNIPEGDKIKRLESLHATKMKLLDTFNGVIQSLSRNGAKNPPEQTNQLGAGVSR